MTGINLDQLLSEKILVIYDDTCGFCNHSVRFILDQEPTDDIRFIAQDSDLGISIREQLLIPAEIDSIIVITTDGYLIKTQAIFHILTRVRSRWRLLSKLRILPTSIADLFYEIIASNRHRLSESNCRVLTQEEQRYFI